MVAPARSRVLLDTHALVWYADNSSRLPAATKQLLADERTVVYVSVVSLWELATLTSLGRLAVAPDLATWLAEVRASSFQMLAVEDHHLVTQVADYNPAWSREWAKMKSTSLSTKPAAVVA